MAHDKAFIEGLFTAEERKQFASAAEGREPAMRWDNLFPPGQDEIVLPLVQEGDVPKSIDNDIERVLSRHNEEAEKAVAAARAEGKNPGSKIRYCQLKRDPENPSLLIVTHNGKEQKDRYRLGKFLDERKEWLLLDALEVELNRQNAPAKLADAKQEPATLDKVANDDKLAADQFTPDSLRVVISRDPMQIAAMSTGRRWNSCMAKGGANYHYVPHDIGQGSLVAYLVAKDDVHARHPLMRQLLKPFRNENGETILVPGYIYGGETLGNSATRTALDLTLRQFVLNGVNKDKTGIFKMPEALYSDGQATSIALNKDWDQEELRKGLSTFLHGAFEEYLTEISQGNNIDKHARALHGLLGEPETLARIYYRKLVGEALGGKLPDPEMIIEEANHIKANLSPVGIRFGYLGAKIVAEALAKNKTINSLFLAANCINDAGTQAIAQALEKNKTLTYLSLGSNNIGDAGSQALASMLEKNQNILGLSATNNNIGDAGAQALGKMLRKNKTIIILDLSGNNISDVGVQALVAALEKRRTPIALQLEQNDFGDAGTITLAAMLENNRSVISLGLSRNNISDEGAKALAIALKKNRSLASLRLHENSINCKTEEQLYKAIMESGNKNFCYIDIGSFDSCGSINNYCRQNEEVARALVCKITNHPNTLTAEDKKEIAERQNAIRFVINQFEEKHRKAVKEYLAQLEHGSPDSNEQKPWQDRVNRAPVPQKPASDPDAAYRDYVAAEKAMRRGSGTPSFSA